MSVELDIDASSGTRCRRSFKIISLVVSIGSALSLKHNIIQSRSTLAGNGPLCETISRRWLLENYEDGITRTRVTMVVFPNAAVAGYGHSSWPYHEESEPAVCIDHTLAAVVSTPTVCRMSGSYSNVIFLQLRIRVWNSLQPLEQFTVSMIPGRRERTIVQPARLRDTRCTNAICLYVTVPRQTMPGGSTRGFACNCSHAVECLVERLEIHETFERLLYYFRVLLHTK